MGNALEIMTIRVLQHGARVDIANASRGMGLYIVKYDVIHKTGST